MQPKRASPPQVTHLSKLPYVVNWTTGKKPFPSFSIATHDRLHMRGWLYRVSGDETGTLYDITPLGRDALRSATQ